MRPIRFGVQIQGAKGRAFADVIAARPDTQLVATCAPGRPVPGVMHYESPLALAQRADLDALIVAGALRDVPRLVATALGRGLHVLSLRPPGQSVEDVITIREAEVDAPGRVLKFSFPLHYHGSVTTAKSVAGVGALGRLLSVRGVFGLARQPNARLRGGMLFDRGMQMLDLMQHFAGTFVEVKAFIESRFWRSAGADDNAFAILRNHDGVVASLHASATSWRETFRLELGYEEGYLWLDGLATPEGRMAPEVLIVGQSGKDAEGRPRANPEEDIRTFQSLNVTELELADFLHAVRGRGPVTIGTSQQAFDAMNIVQRLYADDQTWQPEQAAAAE